MSFRGGENLLNLMVLESYNVRTDEDYSHQKALLPNKKESKGKNPITLAP